jgi:hypothetical protein
MSVRFFPSARHGGFPLWTAAALLTATVFAGAASAQAINPLQALAQGPAPVDASSPRAGEPTPSSTEAARIEHAPRSDPRIDENLQQTSCSSCKGGLLGGPPPDYGVPAGCCGDGDGCRKCCYAGRRPCDCCKLIDGHGCFAELCNGLYECVCCPDPCYEGRWMPIADAAFFLDAARPITQTRLRWDAGWNFRSPDRAEWFMPRFNTNPNQLGPGNCPRPGQGRGPRCIYDRVDYDELFLYNEAAVDAFSFFIEFSYRDLDPTPGFANITAANPAALDCCPHSGFGDMNLGTKSMLLDCELLQFTFQFKTFIPIGNFTQGLGTGHVSLEPAFLATLKLTHDCYMQMMWAYWIPIGGDQLYQGNVFHQHYSLNKLLYKCGHYKTCQIVGTLEFNNWYVVNGARTAPDLVLANPANGVLSPVSVEAEGAIFSIGPGIRLFMCDRLDIGVGSAFATSTPHWAQQLVRSEIRYRY